MSKVKIDGKVYCVETLIHERERLIKEIKASAELHRLVLDRIRTEIEQLPTKTRTNWDGCCPDIDYPQIEYVDVTKNKLLDIIDKYKAESEPQEGANE